MQWLGVAVLLSGIYGLAFYNLRTITVDRQTMVPALWLAVLTGLFVAAYTTFDAYGIRASTDPFTFLAWFFFLDGMTMPPVAYIAWRRMADPPAAGPLLLRGMIGGLVALASFGSVMLATRLDQVGQAAVLRETSTVFAALIGWLMLGERVGPAPAGAYGLDRHGRGDSSGGRLGKARGDGTPDDQPLPEKRAGAWAPDPVLHRLPGSRTRRSASRGMTIPGSSWQRRGSFRYCWPRSPRSGG